MISEILLIILIIIIILGLWGPWKVIKVTAKGCMWFFLILLISMLVLAIVLKGCINGIN